MPDEKIYLSVVVPAYNEEERIGRTLERVLKYLKEREYRFEVIVVDDGSTDKTGALARDFAASHKGLVVVENEGNRGKGFSVRNGIAHARGNYILFSDADLSTPIEDVEKLFPKLLEEGFDIAIGSRGLKRSDVRIHQPWYREGMGKVFNKLVRIFTLRGFKDTQCGFKLFRSEVANEIFYRQRLDGFSFDVEVLYIAKKRGYRIAEVPITWYDSPRSRVNIAGDPVRMFTDVLRIRYYDLKGCYD